MSGQSRLRWLVPDRVWAEASTVRAVANLAYRQNLTYMAAAVAYYAFVSLLPLLLLVVAAASVLGGEPLADRAIGLIDDQLSASGQQLVAGILTDSAGRGAASLVGVVVLAWSGLRLFRGLDQGVTEMYPNEPGESLLGEVRNAVVVGFWTLLVVVAVSLVDIVVSGLPRSGVLGRVALVGVLTLVFLPMYYVLPPVETSVREILVGAVAAAVGWVILQAGFQVYVSVAGQYGAYGVIGALLLFVTWLYFASIVVLLGAAVNAVRRSDGTGSATTHE